MQITHPRTFGFVLPVEQVLMQLQNILSLFRVADENTEVTTQLVSLLQKYPTGGRQIHDANIVATMLAYNIDTLLTFNVDDMKRFEEEITLVPLEQM